MQLGTNIHAFWSTSLPSSRLVPWMNASRAAGVTGIRTDASWLTPPSDTNLVDMVSSMSGLTLMMTMGGSGATWAVPDPWLYAEQCKRLARLLRAGDILELWNEPSLAKFWGGAPDAAGYAHLVYTAYHAIKEVRPDVLVAAGAVVWNDRTFRQAFLGAKPTPDFDLFTFHPYTGSKHPGDLDAWFGFVQTIDDTKADLVAVGRTEPYVISEVGWFPVTDATAALDYRVARDIATCHGVAAMYSYHLGDRAEAGATGALLGAGQVPSLAWNAFMAQAA